MKSLLIGLTLAIAATSAHAQVKARVGNSDVIITSKQANQLICRDLWKKQVDPAVVFWTSQFFMRACKAKLEGADISRAPAEIQKVLNSSFASR